MYGLGGWEEIEADDRLQLKGKFFLEEGKNMAKGLPANENGGQDDESNANSKNRPIPNAIHLVRRTDYLLGCLDEWKHPEKKQVAAADVTASGKGAPSSSVDKSTASTATAGGPSGSVKKGKKRSPSHGGTASPAPGAKATAGRGKGKKASGAASAAAKQAEKASANDLDEESDSGTESVDEDWCKSAMRPVKKTLKTLRDDADGLKGTAKLNLLKESLSVIGARIEDILDRECKGKKLSNRARLDRHLWHFVTFFWPGKDNVRGKKIRRIYTKMLDQDTTPGAGLKPAGAPAAVKQEVGTEVESERRRLPTIKLKRKAPAASEADNAPIPKKSRPSVAGEGDIPERDSSMDDREERAGVDTSRKSHLNGVKGSLKREGSSPSHVRNTPTFDRDEYDDYARQRDRWRERERERMQ